ncbi:hypothetical protein [Halorhabdus rudnickae]|uniref:hypothetical protein n=1 Tax=Halorhabdus rudnickae TaxID=1775544 RepID=UPI0010825CA4|nr:hypothetical protein [Halorhabdus rudnickae]
MKRSRRAVIRSVSVLPLAGLAGCGVLNSEQTETDQPSQEQTQASAETEPETQQETTEGEPQLQYPGLADRTGNILKEIEWFGTTYFNAISQYKNLSQRLYDTTEYLRRRPELSESDLKRLESTAGEFVTLLEDRLAPHFENSEDFTATADIVFKVKDTVSTIRQFSERGDTDRVKSELTSLRVYIDNVKRTEAINKRFSERPIHEPLLAYATSSKYSKSDPYTFIIAHPETEYVAPVRSRKRHDATLAYLQFNTRLDRRKYISDLENIFGGVSVEKDRTGRGFLAAHPRKADQPTRLIDIQRFASAEAAEQARGTILDGPVSSEGMDELGAYEWEQIHYFQELEVLDPHSGYVVFREGDGMTFNHNGDVIREDSGELGKPVEEYSRDLIGDIIYAYTKRVGPYLVTIAPSMTAWEERDRLDRKPLEPLKKIWFWESLSESESKTESG